jgi:hypothetical protein
MPKQGWLSALVLAAVTTVAASPSSADDSFKVAIGQLEIWSGQAPVLGQKPASSRNTALRSKISAPPARARPCRR